MTSPETEIHSTLTTIFTKIQNPSTYQIGIELFKRLIYQNISTESTIHFILTSITTSLTSSLPTSSKEPFLKLLPHIFYNTFKTPSQKSLYYPFISSTLTLLQSLITDTNISLFTLLSNIFADITSYTMITDIELAQNTLNNEERKQYETLQGFCLYNIKESSKCNQICGSLCLTKLVENCPIVLQSKYMKHIWESIMMFIDKKEYNAKYELLNCLISLILGAEGKFRPHAVVTLFKVIEFLTDNDWLKRKLSLNVVYTIVFYCKEEIASMITHLVSFLKLLQEDKVKDVKEIAVSILKLLNEDNSNNNEERKTSRKEDNVEEKKVIKDNKEGMESHNDDNVVDVKESNDRQVTQNVKNDEHGVTTIKDEQHVNNVMNSNSKMINVILNQIQSLSSKQLTLIETLSQIQNETQSQIANLNNKISSLESLVALVSKQCLAKQTQPQSNQYDINNTFKHVLAQNNVQEIINLLSKTTLSQIKNINVDLIETTIERLIPLLSKGEHVKQIISFYKTVLLALRLPLRNEIVQNVKDVLEYVTQSGVDGKYIGNIGEEEIIDISIILSSLIGSK